jgi:ferritin-like metal-binding protein YciE
VKDDELAAALREHRDETKEHAARVETVFRRIEVEPSSNLVRAFESAVEQHDEEQGNIKVDALADVFHAQTALHTEHWEIAQYTATIALADAAGFSGAVAELRETLKEEEQARDRLQKLLDRLTNGACAR